jgi:hypothetical protein
LDFVDVTDNVRGASEIAVEHLRDLLDYCRARLGRGWIDAVRTAVIRCEATFRRVLPEKGKRRGGLRGRGNPKVGFPLERGSEGVAFDNAALRQSLSGECRSGFWGTGLGRLIFQCRLRPTLRLPRPECVRWSRWSLERGQRNRWSATGLG